MKKDIFAAEPENKFKENLCGICCSRVYSDCYKTANGVVLDKDQNGRVLVAACEQFVPASKRLSNASTKRDAFVYNIHTRRWEANKKLK